MLLQFQMPLCEVCVLLPEAATSFSIEMFDYSQVWFNLIHYVFKDFSGF